MKNINFHYIVRMFLRQKTISAITIGGYAISMAVIFILATFIISEKNVNRDYPNYKNIYRVVRNASEANVPLTFLDDVQDKIPGIEKIALFSMAPGHYRMNGLQDMAMILSTNDDFIDIFSHNFILSSGKTTLSTANTLYLTRKFSEKLFGTKNPVGEVLELNDQIFTIAAVISDPPLNSFYPYQAVTGLQDAGSYYGLGYNEEQHKMFSAYLLLNSNNRKEAVDTQIEGLINHWQAFKDQKLTLQPLSEVYFDTKKKSDYMDHANMNMILLLSGVAGIILFMTIFNYINITIATGVQRFTEIGIRKANGASRNSIFRQFLGESYLVTLLAMILAILLSVIISPYFSEVLGKQFSMQTLISQPAVIAIALLILLITGTIAGIYPALMISKITPVQVIQNKNRIHGKNNRAGIVALQFVFTITLITSMLFINKQINFVKHKDLGFDTEQMMRLSLQGITGEKWKTVKEKMLANPQIVSVTASHGSPMANYMSSTGPVPGETEKMIENMIIIGTDEDFIHTFGLSLVDGRNFMPTEENVCIINNHLFRFLEWEDIEGKVLFGRRVIGIIEDFHHFNLYNEIGHLQLTRLITPPPSFLSIKMNGQLADNISFIEKVMQEVEPGLPIHYRFYDDWVQSMYEKEEKQAYAIQLFSLLAIIISCFGLIGMASFTTTRKTKEIGIRKVNGATILEILLMLNKDFVKWVAIAFIIATPIAYYAMNKWLENFAYKTELSWWIFVLAGLLALGIALLTVSWQSWRAAVRNPVEALRYE
jgi:putative ABC transport system permease protein